MVARVLGACRGMGADGPLRSTQMRIRLLGETHHSKHIRPLNEAKAIDAGANFISEAFLFAFAGAISQSRLVPFRRTPTRALARQS